MIRASVHFRDRTGSSGYLCDFAELPRKGDEIKILGGGDGEPREHGRVVQVRHILTAWGGPIAGADYSAGAQVIEITVQRANPADVLR